MPRHQPRAQIIAAAGSIADDHGDGPAAIEIGDRVRLRGCGQHNGEHQHHGRRSRERQQAHDAHPGNAPPGGRGTASRIGRAGHGSTPVICETAGRTAVPAGCCRSRRRGIFIALLPFRRRWHPHDPGKGPPRPPSAKPAAAAATPRRHDKFQKSGLSAVGIAAFLPSKYPYGFSAQTNSGQPSNELNGRR
jgi:hypothetical protein